MQLERPGEESQDLARQFGSVFVVTGPIVGQNQAGKIGTHQITVPDVFFKAHLVYKDE